MGVLAYENPVLWCLISTILYIPKCTGRAREHTSLVVKSKGVLCAIVVQVLHSTFCDSKMLEFLLGDLDKKIKVNELL
jgi:hypothetical protein